MKALILSAFGGENLFPFTSSRPKAMLPIANTNFLESTLIKIKDANESKKNNIALLTANGKISLMN